MDGEIAQLSPATIHSRRKLMDKLLWLLRSRSQEICGSQEMRMFLSYVTNGHDAEGGRWGNPHMTQKVRPNTIKTYQGHLRTFFTWCVEQRVLDESPMRGLRPPIARPDQINPFTQEQVEALLRMAYQENISYNALAQRDAATIWMLCDIGLRVSELCGLRYGDLDMTQKRVTVLGKGNKKRSMHLGINAMKALWALWAYLGYSARDPETPLFCSEHGSNKGGFMTRFGVRDILYRLNERAEMVGVRVSPHTFRHSFAIAFLRRGGTIEALQELLGHTNIQQTLRYKKYADAAIAAQCRFSPGDAIKSGTVLHPRLGDKQRPPRQGMAPAMVERARVTGAAKITRAKLTEAGIPVIRGRLNNGERPLLIAIDYGVGKSTIKQLAAGITWQHVK